MKEETEADWLWLRCGRLARRMRRGRCPSAPVGRGPTSTPRLPPHHLLRRTSIFRRRASTSSCVEIQGGSHVLPSFQNIGALLPGPEKSAKSGPHPNTRRRPSTTRPLSTNPPLPMPPNGISQRNHPSHQPSMVPRERGGEKLNKNI